MALLVREPLHLKYRPKRLTDLAGNTDVVRRLQGMVKTQNIPNAILFSGPSGTGKTTTARILARTLSCSTLKGCGKCDNCLAFDKGEHPDYMELNASNENGVDRMRSLLQQIRFSPSLSPLRFFMLDEAQMLTTQAQNLILKPLEEPPARTLWLIGSMDTTKLSPAIKGRCQEFALSRLTKDAVGDYLRKITVKEGLDQDVYSDAVLEKVSEASGGQMRNAVQLLDSVIQYASSAKKGTSLADLNLEQFIENTDSNTDKVATRVLLGMYVNKPAIVASTLADMDDPIQTVNRLLQFNQYLIDCLTIKGKHAKVWHTVNNAAFRTAVESKTKLLAKEDALIRLIQIHTTLVDLRAEMQAFAVPERYLMTARLALPKL